MLARGERPKTRPSCTSPPPQIPKYSWYCPTRNSTPPSAVSASNTEACRRFPSAAAADASTFVTLEQMRMRVRAAVKETPRRGSPGCLQIGCPPRRIPYAISRPANEKASDRRNTHIPIFPGVAVPYWASTGHSISAWACPATAEECTMESSSAYLDHRSSIVRWALGDQADAPCADRVLTPAEHATALPLDRGTRGCRPCSSSFLAERSHIEDESPGIVCAHGAVVRGHGGAIEARHEGPVEILRGVSHLERPAGEIAGHDGVPPVVAQREGGGAVAFAGLSVARSALQPLPDALALLNEIGGEGRGRRDGDGRDLSLLLEAGREGLYELDDVAPFHLGGGRPARHEGVVQPVRDGAVQIGVGRELAAGRRTELESPTREDARPRVDPVCGRSPTVAVDAVARDAVAVERTPPPLGRGRVGGGGAVRRRDRADSERQDSSRDHGSADHDRPLEVQVDAGEDALRLDDERNAVRPGSAHAFRPVDVAFDVDRRRGAGADREVATDPDRPAVDVTRPVLEPHHVVPREEHPRERVVAGFGERNPVEFAEAAVERIRGGREIEPRGVGA